MLNTLCRVAPDLSKSSFRICPPLSLNSDYLAFVVDQTKVQIVEYTKRDSSAQLIVTHSDNVSCLRLSKSSPGASDLLCSCSTSSVVVWDLQKLRTLPTNVDRQAARVMVVDGLTRTPLSCGIHPREPTVAVCYADRLTAYDIYTASQTLNVRFDDYLTSLDFCLFDPNLILMTSRACSFTIFDRQLNCVVEQVIDSTPKTCWSNTTTNSDTTTYTNICCLETRPIILAVSGTSASLHVYEYEQSTEKGREVRAKVRLLYKISLEQLYWQRRRNTRQQEDFKVSSNNEDEQVSSLSMMCIGMQAFSIGAAEHFDLGPAKHLAVCATARCLLFVDIDAATLLYAVDFTDMLVVDADSGRLRDSSSSSSSSLAIPQAVDLQMSGNGRRVVCAALLFLFRNEICVVKCADVRTTAPLTSVPLPLPTTTAMMSMNTRIAADEPASNAILSVLPRVGLIKGSPLGSQISAKDGAACIPSVHESLKAAPTGPSAKKATQKASVLDKPLTFNARIKSSGYNSTQVKREKFTPLTNASRNSINRSTSLSSMTANMQRLQMSSSTTPNAADVTPKTTKQTAAAAVAATASSTCLSIKQDFRFELPTTSSTPHKVHLTDKSSCVLQLLHSDDGQHLVVVSADGVAQCLPASRIDKPALAGSVYNGHAGAIRCVDVSHDCKLLLSASDDRTCKLWSLKPAKLLLDIGSSATNRADLNSGNRSVSSNSSKNLLFRKEISAANFFYMDKFLLIGAENKLNLCSYFVDANKHDVQRYLNNSHCSLVKQMELTFSQSLCAISAINTFYSYTVICGGSDKSLEVFDMNQAKSCLVVHDAHNRPFHQIVQNGSEFNQHSYDLFLTNAVADGIKLWDLRSAACVAKFDTHLNRCLPTKVAFSADSKYIVCGSEDRSVVVYDVRTNGIAHKYGVFSDMVTCAQFNPKRSQVVCGTQDGRVILIAP